MSTAPLAYSQAFKGNPKRTSGRREDRRARLRQQRQRHHQLQPLFTPKHIRSRMSPTASAMDSPNRIPKRASSGAAPRDSVRASLQREGHSRGAFPPKIRKKGQTRQPEPPRTASRRQAAVNANQPRLSAKRTTLQSQPRGKGTLVLKQF